MAIRERKGRASPWQVYWNNPFTGKRECANFLTREEALKEDSLIKHRLKFERESFQKEEEAENDKPERITLEQAYLLYLREKQFNKKGLAWQQAGMKIALKIYGSTPVSKLEKANFEHVLLELKKMPVKLVTVRNRMSVLRTLLKWCSDQGYCDIVQFPKLPPANYEQFIPPTPDELQAMLSVAPDHIARVIIIGSQCGVRIGECELLKLTWQDVDLSQAILRVHGAKKNIKSLWREVPIKANLIPIFQQWYEQDMTLETRHIIHYKGKPISSIKRAWKSVLALAGITRRIRPYDLRHAFATELIANGADIGTVAKLMGHASPTMLLNHYQYVMDKQKRAAIENLPDINHVPKPCAQRKKARTDLQ